jgi:DNA-binding NarL/FixJ family response regulator
MRVILVGSAGDRDRMRWRLEGTGVTVAGEFATLADARGSGIEADAILLPAGTDGGRLPRTAAESTPIDPLTPREIEVLELLADGLPNKAIADRLGISDQTVKFHVASITGKLGVANRTEAVRTALRQGLITL